MRAQATILPSLRDIILLTNRWSEGHRSDGRRWAYYSEGSRWNIRFSSLLYICYHINFYKCFVSMISKSKATRLLVLIFGRINSLLEVNRTFNVIIVVYMNPKTRVCGPNSEMKIVRCFLSAATWNWSLALEKQSIKTCSKPRILEETSEFRQITIS